MDTTVVIIIGLALVVLAWLWRRPASEPRPVAPAREEPPSEEATAVLAIEDSIDLHGFQPRDILPVVESYLEAAAEEGFQEVRLIHGKGKGVQRRRVQELLARHPLVEDFSDAPAHRGGWGATIAWLKRGSKGKS
jgi:dsDNA-specific endonuclease/ATPase MutS2